MLVYIVRWRSAHGREKGYHDLVHKLCPRNIEAKRSCNKVRWSRPLRPFSERFGRVLAEEHWHRKSMEAEEVIEQLK